MLRPSKVTKRRNVLTVFILGNYVIKGVYMTKKFIQLTYFFYAAKVFTLSFRAFNFVCRREDVVCLLSTKFNSRKAINYTVQGKEEQAPMNA